MIGGNIPSLGFRTFYVSKEETSCPLSIEIIKIGKKMKEADLLKNSTMVVSLSYGKRMLINSEIIDFDEIQLDELLEIVDFDPIKNNLLVIGKSEPKTETPVHWMIHHAREDVNVIVQINGEEILQKTGDKLKKTDENTPIGTLNQAKEILKFLRDEKKLEINNHGVMFVGRTMDEIEKLIFETFEGMK